MKQQIINPKQQTHEMTHITVKSRIPFKAYFKYIFRENFYKPLPVIIFFFALVNLFLLLNYFLRLFYFNLTFPWVQMTLVPLILVVIPVYFYFNNRSYYNNNKELREYKIFEFTQDDVRISNNNSTVLIDWQNFYKIEESQEFLILFFDHATAYFVLKSDFTDVEQLNEVYEIVKSKPGLVQALLK
ncbi:MAG: YcxB family protein [Bacteroidia bacterium]